MSKIYDVQFCFAHGYNWKTVDAHSPEDALRQAVLMVKDPEIEEELVNDASNYDSVGDLEFIEVEGLYHHSPEILVRNAAQDLLEALIAVVDNADEDCPQAYRTAHFNEALEQARSAIAKATCESHE